MGVTGLWRLIEAAGKPIPVETLENKILAIDVSIWLHQLVKGFQDASGKTLLNAHLIGLFHRICKLLYFRIKPIFVFDGGVPALKKKTIAARQRNRAKAIRGADKVRQLLLKNLVKQQALGRVTGGSEAFSRILSLSTTTTKDNLFELPPLPEASSPQRIEQSDSEEDDEKESDRGTEHWGNIHSIDVHSKDFLSLPAEMRHSILSELKETRKQSSWSRAHKMPERSGDFSSFQMSRLLNRRSVQVGIEDAQKQLRNSDSYTMADIRERLFQSGVEIFSQRIASDSSKSFIYSSASDVKVPKGSSSPKRIVMEEADSDEVVQDVVGIANQILEKKEEPLESEDEMSTLFPFIDDKNISQEEILQVIKAQNSSRSERKLFDENQPSTSKAALEYEKSLREKCVNDVDSKTENNGPSCKLEPGTIPENGPLQRITPPSSESSSNVVNKKATSPKELSPVIKNPPVEKKQNGQKYFSESSEDDDENFVQVDSKKGLEIVVDPKSLGKDDDLFADIFSKSSEKEVKTIESNETADVVVEDFTSESDDESFAENNEEGDLESEEDEEEILVTNEETEKGIFEEISKNAAISFEDTLKSLSEDELKAVKENLEEESASLMVEKKREDKIGASISEQFTIEAQELLQIFGVPYIVAPMEAEAQCAFLDVTGQCEGTISDDSDIWLFGGRTAYKNFFDQKKFVLQFKDTDIERCFKLKRDDMILLALLTGSDYTSGLSGVGPVTAMEILSSFPSKDSDSSPIQRLERFTLYYKSGKITAALARKLRTAHFFQGFPNHEVAKAYLAPQVNEDKSPFSWGIPDLNRIREYTRERFGWDQKKTDHTLVPIIEKLKKSSTQKTLHGYFEWATDSFSQERVSKRVIKAVTNWGNPDDEVTEEGPTKRRKTEKKEGHKRNKSETEEKTGKRKKPEIEEKTAKRKKKEKPPKEAVEEEANGEEPKEDRRVLKTLPGASNEALTIFSNPASAYASRFKKKKVKGSNDSYTPQRASSPKLKEIPRATTQLSQEARARAASILKKRSEENPPKKKK